MDRLQKSSMKRAGASTANEQTKNVVTFPGKKTQESPDPGDKQKESNENCLQDPDHSIWYVCE